MPGRKLRPGIQKSAAIGVYADEKPATISSEPNGPAAGSASQQERRLVTLKRRPMGAAAQLPDEPETEENRLDVCDVIVVKVSGEIRFGGN